MSEAIKIVIYGSFATGKTTLVERFKKDTFDNAVESTIGAAFYAITLPLPNGGSIKAQIWDTAGMEKFKSIVPMYLRGATIVIFCFDSPKLDIIREGIRFIRTATDAKIVLVQTKIDIYRANIINEDLTMQLNLFLERGEYKIFYTSAKTGHSVKELFDYCIIKGNEIKNASFVQEQRLEIKNDIVENSKYGCCVIN